MQLIRATYIDQFLIIMFSKNYLRCVYFLIVSYLQVTYGELEWHTLTTVERHLHQKYISELRTVQVKYSTKTFI